MPFALQATLQKEAHAVSISQSGASHPHARCQKAMPHMHVALMGNPPIGVHRAAVCDGSAAVCDGSGPATTRPPSEISHSIPRCKAPLQGGILNVLCCDAPVAQRLRKFRNPSAPFVFCPIYPPWNATAISPSRKATREPWRATQTSLANRTNAADVEMPWRCRGDAVLEGEPSDP